MNQFSIDKKLRKQSNVRVVKSGRILEVYEYEIPYFYNWGAYEKKDIPDETEGTSRAKRSDNVARAQRQIKRLVNCNAFIYGYHPIFITYTFAENIRDIKRANAEFKRHIDELRKRIVGRSLKYVCVPETQKRGAIHYHVVFFDLPYIEGIKQIFAKSWGNGFVQVKAVSHVNNIGAYVSKYFGKQWASDRKPKTKNFFSSEGLQKPEVFRNLDILKSFDNMEEDFTKEFFSSKYGQIKYTQFTICQTSHLQFSKPSRVPMLEKTARNERSTVSTQFSTVKSSR